MGKTLAIILIVSFFMLISNDAYANRLEQKLDESTLKALLNKGELVIFEEENGMIMNSNGNYTIVAVSVGDYYVVAIDDVNKEDDLENVDITNLYQLP